MCGISGIINFNNKPIIENDIKTMMQKMKHRGPDDEGLYIDGNVGLGFVRLSILDLSSAGHQPMFSNDGKLIIIFNGEVYNYIEIREGLQNKYLFKTGTDTEVILAAYQEWGEDCLHRFNGMFAFIIYNTETRELFGARDRFGIKPFYYFLNGDKFIFASEIKSLLPLIENKKANQGIIYDYLLFNRTDHTEDTFFEGIKKLQHGSFFKIENNALTIKNWYNLADNINTRKSLSAEQYRALFKDSLKLRLRADVPIGVSLSGGIDSSSIVASLIKDFNLKELNTFSAIFDKNDPNDESEFIYSFESMVKNMHFISPNAESFFSDFTIYIDAHNEPIPDTNPYVQFKVMQLASKDVTVTLDGQGADEQLAGYHYFFGSYFIELIRKGSFKKFIYENIKFLKIHKSLNAIKYFLYYLFPARIQKSISNQIFSSIDLNFFNNHKHRENINAMLYNPKSLNQSLLQHFEYKLEHLLKWEDLNSMHFSIESRVPFLDHRLVEATLSTPSEQKIYNGETKHILREGLKDVLPSIITNRKDKKGFSNPRDKWFQTEIFSNYILELINSDSFKNRGFFDSKKANIQYKKHLEGKIDISKEIWKWINLELWFRKFIDNN